MKSIIIQTAFTIMAFAFYSCGDNDAGKEKAMSDVKDSTITDTTAPVAENTIKIHKKELERVHSLLDTKILWADFDENHINYNDFQNHNSPIRGTTEYVEFKTAELRDYLDELVKSGYGNVYVYIGKYTKADVFNHPGHTPINPNHKNKITVMFSPVVRSIVKDTSNKNLMPDPPVEPYDVGDPHP